MGRTAESMAFDELVTNFYKELVEVIDNIRNGQLCLAPVPRFETEMRVWRAVSTKQNPYEYATGINFRVHDGDSLFGKKKPLLQPVECRTDEELWCCRVRQRVVIVLANTRLQQAYQGARDGEQIFCDSFMVVPTYEIKDSLTGNVIFHPKTVDRVRHLETPNFFFLPDYPILKITDSLARVDRVFSVCRTILEPLGVALRDEPFQAVRDLMSGFLFGDVRGSMIEKYRECVG